VAVPQYHRKGQKNVSDLITSAWAMLQARAAAATSAVVRDEEGQGLVEYALILVLVSIVCIVILTTVGSQANNVFSMISSTLGSVGS